MFRTVILAEDRGLVNAAETLAVECGNVRILKVIERVALTDYDVAYILSQHDPELILLEATKPDVALASAAAIRAKSPETAVMIVGGPFTPMLVRKFQETGAEVLLSPVTPEAFGQNVQGAIYRARPTPLPHLWLFVPSKAGGGASTIAINTAKALSQGLKKKVLVLEADLHSGVISLMLNATPKVPVLDVLHHASELDQMSWPGVVAQAGPFDLLLTDRVAKPPLPSWANYHQLVRFASSRYDTILADLPEVVNSGTADLVHYAHLVFVVCTPELSSLTLAQQRLKELENRGLPRDRAAIVVNRWHRGDISVPEIEAFLKAKVATVIRNDYKTIHAATLAGSPVKANSDLGKSFLEFARQLDRWQSPEPETKRSGGFLNAFRSLARV